MQDQWEANTVSALDDALASAQPGKLAQLIQLAGTNVGAVYNLAGTLVIGRASNADLRIDGTGISRHHARVRLDQQRVEFEDLGSTNGSFINGQRVERTELRPGDKIQLGSGTILRFGYQDEIDADFHRLMFESASRDMITELCNKRFFVERLSTEFAFATRHQTPLTLIVFAIEGLRRLQRRHGAGAGNELLCALGRSVLATVRSEDLVAHFGSGTFALLSLGIEPGFAPAICERLRGCAARLSLSFTPPAGSVALVFGVAGLPKEGVDTPEQLLASALRALAPS